MPSPSVCTSTNGGANSGKTSTGMSRTRVAPMTSMPTPSATTMKRNCRLDLTIHRIIGLGSLAFDLELGAEQLLAADAHDLGADRRPALEDGDVAIDLSIAIGLRTNPSGPVRVYTHVPPSIQ